MNKKLVSLNQLIVCIILFLLCASSFEIKHGRIFDDKNREIYFHGMNIAVKVPPYVPRTDAYDQNMSFVKQDIDQLKQNGFNGIRLGIMWSGLEPNKDTFNDTYLDEMTKIVNAAGDAGIYTLIQFHQKVLSESFCGIGLPPWLINQDHRYKTFPYPIERQKYPLNDSMTPDKLHCQRHKTSVYFYSYDCAQGFQELYTIDSYLNKKFTKAWQKIAQHFKDNKNVIAYDLLNQPWVGNQIRNPFLLIPGVAQKLHLQKFVDRLSEAIRSVDQNTLICFEPTIVDRMTGTGYHHAPGGDHYKDKSILGYSYGKQNIKSIGFKAADARRLGVASLITQMYSVQCSLNAAEQYYQSWFFFYFKDFGRNRSIQYPQLQQVVSDSKLQIFHSKQKKAGGICPKLIRSYLQRVAGCLTYSQFCPQTGRFIGSYWGQPSGQSILYMNKEFTYKNKYQIQVSPKDEVQIIQNQDADRKNYVKLKYNGKNKTEIVVNVIKVE